MACSDLSFLVASDDQITTFQAFPFVFAIQGRTVFFAPHASVFFVLFLPDGHGSCCCVGFFFFSSVEINLEILATHIQIQCAFI